MTYISSSVCVCVCVCVCVYRLCHLVLTGQTCPGFYTEHVWSGYSKLTPKSRVNRTNYKSVVSTTVCVRVQLRVWCKLMCVCVCAWMHLCGHDDPLFKLSCHHCCTFLTYYSYYLYIFTIYYFLLLTWFINHNLGAIFFLFFPSFGATGIPAC